MRVAIIWRDDSEHGQVVREWLREFEHRTGRTPESLSPDEGDGLGLCKAYDVVEYPTILALDSGGKVVQMWRGVNPSLPRIDDVNFYMIEQ